MKRVCEAWNRFFFEPTHPATLGLFRIGFGLTVLLSLIGKLPDRELFYGAKAIVSADTSAQFFQSSTLGLLWLRLVPSSDPALLFFFAAMIALAICLTFGVLTRLSSILLFVGLVALSNRDFAADNAGDDLIRLNSFFLMFAPAGAAYSLDQWWRKRKALGLAAQLLISPWAQRLLQLQFAYIYLDTVFLKLHGTAWLDGTAIYYALHYTELQRFSADWLFHYLWQIKLATWTVLIIELSMCTLVWSRRFRYYCLAAALCLHAGMNLLLQFPVFQYAMMASLILFVLPEDAERMIGRLLGEVRPGSRGEVTTA